MTQRTHWDDCWKSGPEHYECAVGEVERLRAGHEREAKALCESDNYWRDRAEQAEAEVERLRLQLAAAQSQINGFYLGSPDTRLRNMTHERDALQVEVERLREALVDLVEDICDREDMDDPSMNPGRRRCVAAARIAIDAARGES